MSTLFQPTALVGAIALAMGFSTSVSAQDSSNVVNASLETLVVTASRSEEKIENVPASITVIDHKLIEKNPIFNLSDIIQTSPSVYLKQNGGLDRLYYYFHPHPQKLLLLRYQNSLYVLFPKFHLKQNLLVQ